MIQHRNIDDVNDKQKKKYQRIISYRLKSSTNKWLINIDASKFKNKKLFILIEIWLIINHHNWHNLSNNSNTFQLGVCFFHFRIAPAPGTFKKFRKGVANPLVKVNKPTSFIHSNASTFKHHYGTQQTLKEDPWIHFDEMDATSIYLFWSLTTTIFLYCLCDVLLFQTFDSGYQFFTAVFHSFIHIWAI